MRGDKRGLSLASGFRGLFDATGYWAVPTHPLHGAASRQNRGEETSIEWLRAASNLRIRAGPGGLCCHSGLSARNGIEGVILELSLEFCATGHDCGQASFTCARL